MLDLRSPLALVAFLLTLKPVESFFPVLSSLNCLPNSQLLPRHLRHLRYDASQDDGGETLMQTPSSLTDLLSDLDDWDIRYRPSTTRNELEDLWRRHQNLSSSIGSSNPSLDTTSTPRPTQQSIDSEHLQTEEMDENKAQTTSKPSFPAKPTDQLSNSVEVAKTNMSETEGTAATLLLPELLKCLDDNDIRYEPRTTRPELELLWSQHLQRIANKQEEPVLLKQSVEENQASARGIPPSDPFELKSDAMSDSRSGTERRLHRRQARQESLRRTNVPLSPSLDIPESVQQTADFVTSKARKVSRRARDWWTVDDQGIRNAAFTYVSKIEPTQEKKPIIEVEAQPIPRRDQSASVVDDRAIWTDSKYERSRSRYHVRTASESARPTPKRPSGTTSSPRRPVSRSQAASQSNLWSTRATRTSRSGEMSGLALRRSIRPSPQTKTSRETARRIYSPYADQAGFVGDHDDNRDALDRFGEYVADIADRLMWGKYDEGSNQIVSKNVTSHTEKHKRRRTHSRHWKDRLEERFDYMLGIHENGKYYDSWLSEEKRREREVEGSDAFSYVRGRSPIRKRKYNRPLWEEEGTLWTLLFGRAAPGKKLQFREAVDGEPGQILGVMQMIFRTGLVGAGYACRWASVRGTIPQPYVVMAVSTVAICARKNRLRAILLVLLGLRTFGELVHGYVLGDEGWEESFEDDDQEESNDGYSNTSVG